MPADPYAKQCRLMTDEELVAAVSVDREQYTAQFHLAAGAELSRRGVRLSEFKNRVVIRTPDQSERSGTIEQALEVLDGSHGAFDILSFTNCVGETLTFQPGIDSWVGHYVERGEYQFSFLIGAGQGRRDILKTFLELDDWSQKIAETFDISQWDILMDSSSADRIMSISQILFRENISVLMTDTRLICLTAMRQDYCHGQPFKIMVPQESLIAAQRVLHDIEQKVDLLRREAQQRIREGDRQAELSVLTELAMLVPNDSQVHYRRGSLLLEMGHYEAAADAFIVALIHHHGHEELFGAAYRGLEKVSRILPDNVHILHNLATFSTAGGQDPERAEACYRKIISLKPEDAVAHLQLGYIYYERGDDISAYQHLKRYLELEPESEERDAIGHILGELRSITPMQNSDENTVMNGAS